MAYSSDSITLGLQLSVLVASFLNHYVTQELRTDGEVRKDLVLESGPQNGLVCDLKESDFPMEVSPCQLRML